MANKRKFHIVDVFGQCYCNNVPMCYEQNRINRKTITLPEYSELSENGFIDDRTYDVIIRDVCKTCQRAAEDNLIKFQNRRKY